MTRTALGKPQTQLSLPRPRPRCLQTASTDLARARASPRRRRPARVHKPAQPAYGGALAALALSHTPATSHHPCGDGGAHAPCAPHAARQALLAGASGQGCLGQGAAAGAEHNTARRATRLKFCTHVSAHGHTAWHAFSAGSESRRAPPVKSACQAGERAVLLLMREAVKANSSLAANISPRQRARARAAPERAANNGKCERACARAPPGARAQHHLPEYVCERAQQAARRGPARGGPTWGRANGASQYPAGSAHATPGPRNGSRAAAHPPHRRAS